MSRLVILHDPDNPGSDNLAERLNLPLVGASDQHDGLLLSYQNHRLTLSQPSLRDAGTVCVDFCDVRMSFRITQALSREAVVRAVGGCIPKVSGSHRAHHLIDATAGLGQDAFILAAAGWQVSLIEQSPVIHALLEDGLQRARNAVSGAHDDLSLADQRHLRMLSDILPRMQLLEPGDSIEVLPDLTPASVIYLDPMFPTRDKAARVKKNRFLLQHLHGAQGAGEGLLPCALALASKVVVKRPRLAQPLEGVLPASSLSGKTSRFDIYVGKR